MRNLLATICSLLVFVACSRRHDEAVANPPPPAPRRIAAPADFDGDGISEPVLYRGGVWLSFGSAAGPAGRSLMRTAETSPGCIPVPADYDGDGKTDFAIDCAGAWHIYNADGTYRKGVWTGGVPGDLPVPADYDGDGRADVAVFRAGAWMFYDTASGANTRSVWTGPGGGVTPLPMDYDGDGRADFTIYQKGVWHFYHRDGTYYRGLWTGGAAGDVPVPGSYHRRGRDEVVIFRDGGWTFFDLETRTKAGSVWTGATAASGRPLLPAPLDLDGDGTLELTVYAGGPWHVYKDDGTYLQGLSTGGAPNDQPISRRQLP